MTKPAATCHIRSTSPKCTLLITGGRNQLRVTTWNKALELGIWDSLSFVIKEFCLVVSSLRMNTTMVHILWHIKTDSLRWKLGQTSPLVCDARVFSWWYTFNVFKWLCGISSELWKIGHGPHLLDKLDSLYFVYRKNRPMEDIISHARHTNLSNTWH